MARAARSNRFPHVRLATLTRLGRSACGRASAACTGRFPRSRSSASRPPVEVQVRITPGRSLRHRRAAGQGGGRKLRARAQRAARRRPRPALQARDGEPGAGRPAEGRQPVRPADPARHDGGDGGRRARRGRRLRGDRRTGARRLDPRRARRAARRHRRQRHGQGADLSGGLRTRGGVGRRRRRHPGGAASALARQSLQGAADAGAAEAGPRARSRRRCPTSPTSKVRRAPSGRSRSPPRAGTTC